MWQSCEIIRKLKRHVQATFDSVAFQPPTANTNFNMSASCTILQLTLNTTSPLQYGLGDLTDGGPTPKGQYNGGHEPYNEAW